MKKKFKCLISLILVFTMIFSFTTNVFAADLPIISNIESMKYYEGDGTYIEKITFVENGEDAAVIKRTYTNGSFDVEAVNGESSIIYEGATKEQVEVVPPSGEILAREVTYPYYTDYWYAGSDQYSVNSAAFTAAGIAAAMAAATGIPIAAALSMAVNIYGLCDGSITSNAAYFTTFRYYATLENGPGLPTVWYNKFTTYTFGDSGRTNQICDKVTEVFESSSPM